MERRFVAMWLVAAAMCAGVIGGCTQKTPAAHMDADARNLGSAQGQGSLQEHLGGRALGEDGPLRDVHFDYDSYDLRAEDRAILQANAEWMRGNPKAKIEIEGHCDERGTGDYNLALGGKRAHTVHSYLLALGIPAERFSTISYGDELPVCREETESCWARNRRARSAVSY